VYGVAVMPILMVQRWRRHRAFQKTQSLSVSETSSGRRDPGPFSEYHLVPSSKSSTDSKQAGAAAGAAAAAGPEPLMLPPRWCLLAIGVMNGTGNFLTAIGIINTRAVTQVCLSSSSSSLFALKSDHQPRAVTTQTLLALTGIPLTMLFSRIYLKTRVSLVAAAGAALIMSGALVSSLPSIINPSDDGVHEVCLSLFPLLSVCPQL
jgi:hypothetical protein